MQDIKGSSSKWIDEKRFIQGKFHSTLLVRSRFGKDRRHERPVFTSIHCVTRKTTFYTNPALKVGATERLVSKA